ncbi:uncharacterized protein [Gossypium hirsutum]|uniref:Retrotransposon gag domain-containing protein n=1 Tax=Gossypium hirsutum TaxID=3635 RepID=A0ABM2ZBJ6_GOSHI|nr:uncharacterized protein LOC107921617 [Gossypium hirsutum]
MPAREAPESPVTETGSHDRAVGDDALSQAMLRVLELGRGSSSERLQANGAEIFRGVSSVAPNVAEYWLEATERIMDDLDYTVKQKLKGAVSLLRDEAYQWWLTMRDGKYIGESYVDARKKEFLNLTQGNKTVAEYEAKFLRLSRYARRIVATEYEHYVQFEDGLRDELRVLIAPQREWDFAALVEKEKIAEDVKRSKRQNREKDRGRFKRDSGPLGSSRRPIKKARFEGPARVVPITMARPQNCVDCGRSHQGGGQARGGNSNGHGRGAPDGGAGNTEVRQPALVYAARRREDGDSPDVIAGPSVGDIRTVKEFLDVFPDELPPLPLNREVKFEIELLLGTPPVSIALYRMTPNELVELNAQIQKLLD